MKICFKCKENKESDLFYFDKRLNRYYGVCNACRTKNRQEREMKKVSKLLITLMGGNNPVDSINVKSKLIELHK